MHAGGVLRPSQTTGSMLVRLQRGASPEVFATGTSAPCLSLFQPLSFQPGATGGSLLLDDAAPDRSALWHQFERVHQRALGDRAFGHRLRASRDALEPAMFDPSTAIGERSARAVEWHERWFEEAGAAPLAARWYSPYDRFWQGMRQANTR